MDYLISCPESLTWFHKTLLVVYFLGFLFCVYLKGIIEESKLKNCSKPVRYIVLFLIWAFSPAVILGFIVLTIKVFFTTKSTMEEDED